MSFDPDKQEALQTPLWSLLLLPQVQDQGAWESVLTLWHFTFQELVPGGSWCGKGLDFLIHCKEIAYWGETGKTYLLSSGNDYLRN